MAALYSRRWRLRSHRSKLQRELVATQTRLSSVDRSQVRRRLFVLDPALQHRVRQSHTERLSRRQGALLRRALRYRRREFSGRRRQGRQEEQADLPGVRVQRTVPLDVSTAAAANRVRSPVAACQHMFESSIVLADVRLIE